MLKSIGIIEAPLHEVAMETIERRQESFLDEFGEYRWPLSFVHGWGKPFGVSAEAFEVQKEAFVRSLDSSEPLSKIPEDPTDFAPILEDFKEPLSLLVDQKEITPARSQSIGLSKEENQEEKRERLWMSMARVLRNRANHQ